MAVQLNVIVIGGGISGLAVALGLKRSGHNVTIYERYAIDTEPGAGLVVSHNGTRILLDWGLEIFEKYGFLKHNSGALVSGLTAEKKGVRPGYHQDVPGAWRTMTTRADLRGAIRDEVLGKPKPGEGNVEIVYGSKINEYDPKRPAVQLPDGSWREADLIVACDGIKSKAPDYVVGKPSPATPSGNSAFRLAIPRDLIMKSELVRHYKAGNEDEIWFCADREKRVFVWWTCHFGEVHCFDIVIRDNEKYASKEAWLEKCDKSVLLAEFAEWHPLFKEILTLADDPYLWKICTREPLSKVYRDKLVLVGDALHPMPPFKAQGSTMAIEDAGVLEMCLANLKSIDDLSSRLELYEKLRLPRTYVAQLTSNIRFDAANEDTEVREAVLQAKEFLSEELLNRLTTLEAVNFWFASLDARQNAREAVINLDKVKTSSLNGY